MSFHLLHEFAVDPECLADWNNFRFLTSHFGISQGRLISEFPKKWKRMVHDACKDLSFIHRQKLPEELDRLKKHALIKSGRQYDSTLRWTENAVEQHQYKPFHSVITHEHDSGYAYILKANELSGSTPQWIIPRDGRVQRTPKDLCAAVMPLLSMSKHIKFIDPHFEPGSKRFQNTLSEFIKLASIDRANSVNFEYHLPFEQDNGGIDFKTLCEKYIIPLLPTDVTIAIFRWEPAYPEEGWHARYILTEKGGVRVDWGLDEGHPGQKTDIALLDNDFWKERWENFDSNKLKEKIKNKYVFETNMNENIKP